MIHKINQKKLNTKGFTLIELIVVIAVLSILAAIAIPRLSGFKASAASSVDEANAKILTDIAHRIEVETGNFPTETDWGSSFTKFPASKTPYLDKNIEIQNSANEFEYDGLTGTVTVYGLNDGSTPPVVEPPPSGGSALQNTVYAKILNISNPTSPNPIITLPSDTGVTYVFTTGSSKGNATVVVDINGTTATVTRPPGGQRYLTLTLKATQGNETVTRIFNVTIPKTGTITVQ